ncbi:MAG: ABC transporter ATP-binding protein [Desulfobacterales bacterium]|nr:ABC transporter ATP-binding protein [Desulfobacterales bacterium]
MHTITDNKLPIMQVRGLKKYFTLRQGLFQKTVTHMKAVDGVDFDICKGQTLGLVGESGCGKTTVARLILHLLTADAGEIRFRDRNLVSLTERQFKPLRKEIQIVFQDPYSSLNPRMTVGASIGEGVRITGISDRAARQKRIARLLDMVGMPAASAGRYPHEFSGGQRQRVGIARALSVNPSLIICDEPVSALDVSIQAQIINLLKDLQEELELSYLFISHDLNVVSYLCSRVCVMYRGQIVESAPAEELFDQPRHPYTHALLASILEPGSDVALGSVNGSATATRMTVADPPGACVYGALCPNKSAQCAETGSPLVEVAPDHFVRCFNREDRIKSRWTKF